MNSPTEPGFYYVGYLSKESMKLNPPANFTVGMPLSNTKPKTTRAAARKEAKAHKLSKITVIHISETEAAS